MSRTRPGLSLGKPAGMSRRQIQRGECPELGSRQNYTVRGDYGLNVVNVDDWSKDDFMERFLPLQWAIDSVSARERGAKRRASGRAASTPQAEPVSGRAAPSRARAQGRVARKPPPDQAEPKPRRERPNPTPLTVDMDEPHNRHRPGPPAGEAVHQPRRGRVRGEGPRG